MIYLVGAGPGSYELLTLRAYEVIKRADVVIFDRLAGDGVLSLIPESAECIDAGKISGFHKINQREIERIMIERSREGKNVVRLKGGDPFLFGRGGEEAEAIIRAGLEFEIVPGVSSALSVPAYSGIPATHRDYCSGVNIFTAHDKNNMIPDFNNTTSIFLMGVANSFELQEKLLQSMKPETPCAVIENGTMSSQRVIRCRLSELHEEIIRNAVTPPTLIIVGKTAELNLNRRENLPLNKKRIIITRPEGRGEKLSFMLRNLGAEVIMMPVIKTDTIKKSLDDVEISGYDWAGFTSVTGVNSLIEILRMTGRDIRELGNSKIAAIGSATKEALNFHGLKTDYVPDIFDGKNLAEGLVKRGGKILMFRAENGTPEIDKVFRENEISFKNICVYRINYVKLSHVPNFADIIIFTSSSTVRGFAENTDTLRGSLAVCIGKQTADEALRAGFKNIRIAERAEAESIVKACS